MSVKLANGEKLIRNYEYGTVDLRVSENPPVHTGLSS